MKLYFRQEQLSTQMTGQTAHRPNISDNVDNSRQTETTKIQTTTNITTSATNSPSTSTYRPHVFPLVSTSTTTFTGRMPSTTIDNSSGTDDVLTDRSTSNASSEKWRPSTDTDEYYTDETEMAEKNIQQTGLTSNNVTDEASDDVDNTEEKYENESGVLLQQLSVTNNTAVNISGSVEIDSSNLTAVSSEGFVPNRPQSQTSMSRPGTTSTARPLSTAWLFAELPSDSDWTKEVHSSGQYVVEPRESPSTHAMMSPATFSSRFGPHWKLFQRLSRPARRRTGYRQILASPFVAGGGAMTERERKRALLQAYLLSGIVGKDLSHRRALKAAVFYRSKLAKPPTTQSEVGGLLQQTRNAELSSRNLPAVGVSASPQDSDRADVTTSWTADSLDSGWSTWSPSSSVSLNDSTYGWMSADNTTSNVTSDEVVSAVGTQLRHSSSSRAAAAAVVIPIIIGFLESLTQKQFSWLDMTLAVCGTVAVVLGLINLVVFVVHLLRTKRGKLSFHSERHASSSSPSSMSASRSSSDSTPPPPPPPPPLPLAGFGGLARSSREVSRDVLADDETLRIRPLTFKRPLTDWGFTNSHGLTGTTETAVAVQGGAVTVKSTGSDASSSGIESTGGRSDVEPMKRALENSGNVAVGSSVITNYAYCGNGAVNRGIIIDVDDYRDRTCTSPSDFVFGKNYGQYYDYCITRRVQISTTVL